MRCGNKLAIQMSCPTLHDGHKANGSETTGADGPGKAVETGGVGAASKVRAVCSLSALWGFHNP